ncbi:MAG: DUF1523 family protein [Maritimibacter harenae]|jgi:hypothetical protein|uniref:DUF1523 family protein n=1 Tax=Maritimibacter harenae TaxID=2606218 RepID=A0A845M4K9_9RHOB|nr:DUF1523 family protein [Maritimibacter harenae]MZR12413.1 DUF1523 family protein [Maritimibacter harenae]
MRYVRNTILTIFVVAFGLLLLYVLPRHDVARITGTEIIRMDFSALNRPFYAQSDSASTELATRDVRLINTVKKREALLGLIRRDAERVFVYRNEDTGWIWPPYFKFDSSDLQAEALANVSAPGEEQWVVITRYGWRNRFFSIYPNAVAIKPVAGPDVTIIPWFNIFFFIFLAAAALFIRTMWRQFRERTLDPAMQDGRDAWDKVDAYADERRGRLSRWWKSWTGR